jgi:hypothetical protein
MQTGDSMDMLLRRCAAPGPGWPQLMPHPAPEQVLVELVTNALCQICKASWWHVCRQARLHTVDKVQIAMCRLCFSWRRQRGTLQWSFLLLAHAEDHRAAR